MSASSVSSNYFERFIEHFIELCNKIDITFSPINLTEKLTGFFHVKKLRAQRQALAFEPKPKPVPALPNVAGVALRSVRLL